MAYLILSGITMPVALDQGSRKEPMLVGEDGTAFSGADLSNVRGWKEGWKAKLTPQLAATAAALRGLVKGDGFSWSYDSDLYADLKGLGPSLSTGCSVVATGKYGSRLQITATNKLQYSITGSATRWALSYWKLPLEFYGSTWEHFILLGDGSKYKNGAITTDDTWASYDGSTLKLRSAADVYPDWQLFHEYAEGALIRGGTANNIFAATQGGNSGLISPPDFDSAPALEDTVFDNEVIWTNYGNGKGYFDDVRFLPYPVPSDWPALIYAEANARAQTPLPHLRLAGDAAAGLNAGYATVKGRLVGDPPHRRGVISGSDVTNAEELELELREA